MLTYLIKQAARELLAPVTARVVEHLGGEPAGMFEEITEEATRLIENHKSIVADIAIVLEENAALEQRAEAAEARVKVLERSAEPVAWFFPANFGGHFVTEKPDASSLPYATGVYTVPPPAAIGVEGELFVAASVERRDVASIVSCGEDDEPEGYIGTREEAEVAASDVDGLPTSQWAVYRLVPADAPTVDVTAIRKALAVLRTVECKTARDVTCGNEAFDVIAAAIGEKGG